MEKLDKNGNHIEEINEPIIESVKIFEYKGYDCEVKVNVDQNIYLGYFFISKSNQYYEYELSKLNEILIPFHEFDDDIKVDNNRRIGFIFRSWILSNKKIHAKMKENREFAIEKVSDEIKINIDRLVMLNYEDKEAKLFDKLRKKSNPILISQTMEDLEK